MSRIMIVDDETPSRKQIRNELINLGYTADSLAEASNGMIALELAETFQPDILLTDISMPKMYGVDLAQYILELYPKCKIIFFSGYSDKAYLKAAIKLNVVDYLEKPLDLEELAVSVKKAEEEVKKLTTDTSEDDASMELLECLFKQKKMPEKIKKNNCYKILYHAYFAAVIVVQYSERTATIMGALKELSAQYSLKVINRYRNNGTLELLFAGNSMNIKQDIQKVFQTFFLQTSADECFKCAIGSFEKNVKDIYSSYENAVCALDNAFFYRPNIPVLYTEQYDRKLDHEKITDSLYKALANENYEEARYIVNSLYKVLCKSNFLISSNAKKIYYEMFETIHSFYEKSFFAYSSEYSLYDDTFNIYEAKFLEELNHQIHSLLNRTEEMLLKNTDLNSIVKSALYYIEKNFSNPNLSIVDIAQYCNVNANYLCGIFKASTGETINYYVNKLRIDKAKKMVLETNKSISDISGLCGFNDSKYFCKVFAKYTNTTPTSFRKKCVP